ncbi:hypothetical protein SMICM304S_03678 [Streptomyces microflavus]
MRPSSPYAVQITSHVAARRTGPTPSAILTLPPGSARAADASTLVPDARCIRHSVTAAPAAAKSSAPRPTRVRWCRWL